MVQEECLPILEPEEALRNLDGQACSLLLRQLLGTSLRLKLTCEVAIACLTGPPTQHDFSSPHA